MMKTIAILLLSALAFAGCATDAPENEDTIEIEKPTSEIPILEPAVAAWAKEFVDERRPISIDGGLEEWAEELILGDRLYTLLHGKATDRLYDAFGNVVLTLPCRVCERGL